MSLIRRERRGKLLVLALDKPRGNAIDAPLIEELIFAAREAEADAGVAGVLLASAHPKLFSPGLDLTTLIEYDRGAMRAFMLRFAEAVWALYGLGKPLVAAVNGAAVAGGCILALTADWRVLKRGAPIGLNEVKIGVPLPWSVALLLKSTTGPEALARVALLGRNFESEEAIRAGLADELAEDDGLQVLALERLQELADKDAYAFARTKHYLRRDALAAMRAEENALLDEWLAGWFAPATQARIRQTVASLGRK